MTLYFATLDLIATFDNVTSQTDISITNLCSYCYVKQLELMQQDAYSSIYNEDWESVYEYVAATCNLTVINFNATQSAFNATLPISQSNCVSGNIYTTEDGDTCDSIALAQGISAATMYYTNPNILNCSDIITGTTLCLPLTCTDLYSVESNDTCATVAVTNLITSSDVMNWNSQLNSNCSNLVSPDPYWGSVLCVSAPGGNYTGQALTTTSTGTTDPVDPPVGVKVAVGSTLDCGGWFVNEASLGYNCSDICLDNSIAIHLFVDANPSLNYTTCDSDLVTGDAYCIDPLTGWESYNSTGADATYTVSAATSPAWPVQTGIASDCDAYYEAQCRCFVFPFPMIKKLYINTRPANDTCATIIAEFGITLAEFLTWNPAVSSDCTSGLWAEEDYCVGTATSISTSTTAPAITTTSTFLSSTVTSSTTSSSVTPPAPVQSGIAANCNEYYIAQCTLSISFYLFL